MFTSKSLHYHTNVRLAVDLNAKPAQLTAPDESQEPAVVIFKTRQIYGVLPVSEALRLANEIADAVAAHRTRR